jgi:5,5'-dehydrodivanillate O-demethylase oxygenase subunit
MTPEENERLTRVGPGTEMGALLRRYWHPVAGVAELDDNPIKAVRLFGEDLVLYRDRSGTYGLLARACPHRRSDLSYGYVEACGLRCSYHGWRFDESGACTAQPFEDQVNETDRFRDAGRTVAYRAEAHAGLVWAYLGPEPAPLVPNYEPFRWTNGYVQIVLAEVPCNWLQCQENSIDPVHFEWMHDNRTAGQLGKVDDYSPRHLKLGFDEFEHGFVYRRLREDSNDETNPLWSIGRVCLWPNALFTGDHFEWRVPIDDERTLSIMWAFNPVPIERRPYRQERIPCWSGPIVDAATGRWITSHVMNQDFVAWVGQGVIADRTGEHLGRSDRGVVMLRRRFVDDLDAVASMTSSRDPKAIVRDPAVNECIELPIIGRDGLRDGITVEQYQALRRAFRARFDIADPFIFQYGQPDDIRAEYEAVMGPDGL